MLFIRLPIIGADDVAAAAAAVQLFQALKKVLQTYLHTRLWCVNSAGEVINICLCYIITFHYVAAAPIRLTLRRRLGAQLREQRKEIIWGS